MADRASTSLVGFGVVAVAVLVVTGYLGWQAFNSPADPLGAELAAKQATEVVVRAGGGDARACGTMEGLIAEGAADGVVERCTQLAAAATAGGMRWLGVRGLHVTESDLGRGSGHVTVTGTLLTPAASYPMAFTWPVSREDDQWKVSGGAEVDVQ